MGTFARAVLVTYFPAHEGTLEKTITVGEFQSPMYCAYLLTTISPGLLARLHQDQSNT